MIKHIVLSIAFLLAAASLTGCGSKSGNSGEPQAAKANDKPIEIVFSGIPLTEAEFEAQFGKPIHDKFPHITAKFITPGKGTELKDLVSAGTQLDVYMTATVNLPMFLDMKLDQNLNELIKKYNYDLSKLEPRAIQSMKDMTSDQRVFAIPYQNASLGYVLYYNKDLFDKFGVSYPKDGMIWDDAYELAKRLTRIEGGIQYRGFSANWSNIFVINNQLSLPVLDASDKAVIQTDAWKMVFNNIKRFYEIPGNGLTADSLPDKVQEGDFLTGTVAMTVGGGAAAAADKAISFDYVALPTYKEAPQTGTKSAARYLLPTNTSKYKDDVFQVVAFLTSDEYQLNASKDGRSTALQSKEIQQTYMQNNPKLKDKNNYAYFYNKPSAAAKMNPELISLNPYLFPAGELAKVLLGESDVATALRTAEEKLNQAVAARKKQ
ncbi:ABC transporter substrate-binding protein [Paenibacillus ginsengarvi]|uniref:Extracellular solute-binding protein n=1 Tax=Paenibacillus ginsengarvi TaxID=400777 RepID=A0A3B0ALK7_9BACL|nr:extracellular solute-binding protein [Paenibacillus ginsengarvi]RKN61331.1 extracellular solute-binding protein [Paenibacillus ginsengarvi]